MRRPVRHARVDGRVGQLKQVAGNRARSDRADLDVPAVADQHLGSQTLPLAIAPVARRIAVDVAEDVAATVAVEEEAPGLGLPAQHGLEDGDVELGVW